MSVTAVNLTSGVDADAQATYVTASISPTANYLVLATFGYVQAAVGVQTLTGANLTWVKIGSTITDGSRNMVVFRALGTPTSGALTFTPNGTGNPSRCNWTVSQLTNIDITGSDGANAVVQTATNTAASANTLTVTLGAFADSGNATYGSTYSDGPNGITVGSGFSELGKTLDGTAGIGIQDEFKATNDTSVDWSYGDTTTELGFAAEIKFVAPSDGGGFFNLF